MPKRELDADSEVATTDNIKLKEPKLYKVLLLNDNYSTMEFVVSVLETIFLKSPAEAVQIMLAVHKQGRGLCGLYPKEIAETKVNQVRERARSEGHPLRCLMEEE